MIALAFNGHFTCSIHLSFFTFITQVFTREIMSMKDFFFLDPTESNNEFNFKPYSHRKL